MARSKKSEDDGLDEVWPRVVYATAGGCVQELVYNQAELDDALANGWRLTENSETGA
jgi:hypothetical protein